MKVAIIDDSDDKIKALVEVVKGRWPLASIDIARSFHTAMRLVKEKRPDVVVLDMTLPTSESSDGQPLGRRRLYGGREILAEMDFEELHSRVIICTQFDSFPGPAEAISLSALFAELAADYPDLYVGGIFFSHVSGDWKIALNKLLSRISSNP